MSKRATLKDVAREANVSLATVDRVLHGRVNTRSETVQAVYDAAVKLDYHSTSIIARQLREQKPSYRLGFLLQKEKQEFYSQLRSLIETTAEQYPDARIDLEVGFIDAQSPSAYAEAIQQFSVSRQAIACVALDHPIVTAAVEDVVAKGIAVYSLLSDFAQVVRSSYVGLNNRKVGRATAWMIAKMAQPGKVALFVGGYR